MHGTRYFGVMGAIVLLVLALTGCSQVTVSQDYLAGRDFGRLHTFRWQQGTPEASRDYRVNNPLLQERFRQAIEGTLSRRGYTQAAVADFLVSYSYSVETRFEAEPFRPSFGFGVGRYHDYGAFGIGTDYNIRQFDVGVLVIDFFEARTGAPIWRGTATQVVTTHSRPEDLTAFVYRMVDEVLAQFPPP